MVESFLMESVQLIFRKSHEVSGGGVSLRFFRVICNNVKVVVYKRLHSNYVFDRQNLVFYGFYDASAVVNHVINSGIFPCFLTL